jgi:HEAT repeat protein
LLIWVWSVSIGFMVISLATMAALITVRAVTSAQSMRKAEWRAEALERIFKMLAEDSTVQLPARTERGYTRLLTGLASDLLALLKGLEHQQLVEIFQAAGVREILIADLRHWNARLAQAAAENLRYFRSPESVAALRRALVHRTPEVRLAAALSLAEMEEAPPVEELVRILDIGSAEQSRLVVELFRRLAAGEFEPILAIAADRSRPALLRLMALEALVERPDPRLVEVVSAIARDESGDIASQAIRFLGGLGDRSVAPIIAAALASEDWRIRVQAATAAGRLGLVELSDQLTELLNDDAWWVRHRAGEALGSLRGAGIEQLRAISAKGEGRSRRAASLALDTSSAVAKG